MFENEINEISFTKKCILMSVLSQDKNVTLVNPFTKIPVAKLYTADESCEHFIYTKVKGALCLFLNKDPKKKVYYFRIYELNSYTLAFNMELQKEHLQYITQYQDDFYFMELENSFLGFKFLSKESGRIFFQLLNEDPNKETLDQNEYSQDIDPRDISSTLPEVINFIKDKLDQRYGNIKVQGQSVYRRPALQKNADKFKNMIINDKKGEYLDLSMIIKIFTLVNNLESDDHEQQFNLFTENKLDFKECQKLLQKYDMEKKGQLNIIDKDCRNIINKDSYVTILVNNFINNIRTLKRLDIFRKEYRKRMKEQNKSKPRKSKVFQIGRRRSTIGSNTTSSSGERRLTTINERLSYNPITKTQFQTEPNSDKKDNYSQKIEAIGKTDVSKELSDDDDDGNTGSGVQYFTENTRSTRSNTANLQIPKEKQKKKSFFGNLFGKKEKNNNVIQEIPEEEEKENKKAKKTTENKGGSAYKRPEAAGKSSMSNFLNNTNNNSQRSKYGKK